MKKIFTIAIIGAALLPLTFCGNARGDNTATGSTNVVTAVSTTTTTIDRFDDTEWQNVLATLKQYLRAEQNNPIPENKINAGKALALAAKFMKQNMSEPRYGFTRADIDMYVQRARMLFENVVNDPTSTSAQKQEAKAEIAKLSGI